MNHRDRLVSLVLIRELFNLQSMDAPKDEKAVLAQCISDMDKKITETSVEIACTQNGQRRFENERSVGYASGGDRRFKVRNAPRKVG